MKRAEMCMGLCYTQSPWRVKSHAIQAPAATKLMRLLITMMPQHRSGQVTGKTRGASSTTDNHLLSVLRMNKERSGMRSCGVKPRALAGVRMCQGPGAYLLQVTELQGKNCPRVHRRVEHERCG
jgi:hypothetical protein